MFDTVLAEQDLQELTYLVCIMEGGGGETTTHLQHLIYSSLSEIFLMKLSL